MIVRRLFEQGTVLMQEETQNRLELSMLASLALSLPMAGVVLLAVGSTWLAAFLFLAAEVLALQVGYLLNDDFRRHGVSRGWRRFARLLLHRDDRPPESGSDADRSQGGEA